MYWNERGAIACPRHIPYPGSDTYVDERWQLMTAADRTEYRRTVGHPPACEVCRIGADVLDARERRRLDVAGEPERVTLRFEATGADDAQRQAREWAKAEGRRLRTICSVRCQHDGTFDVTVAVRA